MSYYECKKCFFQTKQKIGMIRHLNKKNKCVKNIFSYKYSDDELYHNSLIMIRPNNDNKNVNTNENNCDTYCKLCAKNFSTKGNLTKHLKKDICIKPFESVGKTKLENHELVPFDNNWDTSKILDEEKKYLICYSTTKYSELLKYILKNENNLNVIIEDETETGIIYKNRIDCYVTMTKAEIIDQVIFKLNHQINIICAEVEKNNEIFLLNEKIIKEREYINKRYDDYLKNIQIKVEVSNIICEILNYRKDTAIKIMNNIIYSDDSMIENKSGF